MMSVDPDLYELNLTYLFKAREMALAGESHKASVILGISPDSVNRLSELSIEKIRTLAKSGVLCFQSRLPDKFWKDLHTSGFDEELTMARILLMISGEIMANITAHRESASLAYELVRRKLRTPIVHLYTGMPLAEIRELYRELHGRSPSSGLLPSISTLLPNRQCQIYVSLFASIYRRLGGEGVFKNIDIQAIIKAWDLFLDLTRNIRKKRPDNITEAWVIARDIRINAAVLSTCPRCATPYLSAPESKLPPTCPICSVARRSPSPKGSTKLVRTLCSNVNAD